MKSIIFFGLIAFVTAQTLDLNSLAKSPSLQYLFECRPGENCANKISTTRENFRKAVEEACPKCSSEQKNNMALWIDAYKRGVSISEANRLYNPDTKYFDIAYLNPSA